MTMGFWDALWDALKKGMSWGFWLGFGLSILVILPQVSNSAGVDAQNYLETIFLLEIACIVLGGTVALIILGIIGTLQFINWGFIFLGGSIITLITPVITGVLGWISVAVIPILWIAREYLSEKSPEWIEKALNQAIVAFLTSLIFSILYFGFQKITGVSLLMAK